MRTLRALTSTLSSQARGAVSWWIFKYANMMRRLIVQAGVRITARANSAQQGQFQSPPARPGAKEGFRGSPPITIRHSTSTRRRLQGAATTPSAAEIRILGFSPTTIRQHMPTRTTSQAQWRERGGCGGCSGSDCSATRSRPEARTRAP